MGTEHKVAFIAGAIGALCITIAILFGGSARRKADRVRADPKTLVTREGDKAIDVKKTPVSSRSERVPSASVPQQTRLPRNSTASGTGMVPVRIDLPRPMFVGTPQDSSVPHLEKPLGRSRPPFFAPEGTKNVALGKPISGSDEEPIIGELEMITDGDKEAADGSYVELGPFAQYVTIDLEAVYEIYAIVVWHYHKQARVYYDVVVQIADDVDFITNVKTVFNNDMNNSAGLGLGREMHYTETSEGKLIDVLSQGNIKGRYVRLYSNGNTGNDLNHYIEVEVYGRPTNAPATARFRQETQKSVETPDSETPRARTGSLQQTTVAKQEEDKVRTFSADGNWSDLHAGSIQQALQLAEEQDSLAVAVLIISKCWDQALDVREYSSRLDDIVLEIHSRLRRKKLNTGIKAIPVINEYLFDELGFTPAAGVHDTQRLFLHVLLDTKQGDAMSLSILYLLLAERLNLPVHAVVVPGHIFVRYEDEHFRFNVETTRKGNTVSDEYYTTKFKVPEGDNIYMKNLNKSQALGCFLNNLGNSYSDVGDQESAMVVFEKAVEINPMLSESKANLGNIYLKKNLVNEAITQYLAALRINPHDAKTHNNLGNAYSQNDSLSYSIGEYLEAIRLDPGFVDAHKNLAIAYSKQKRYEQAIEQLRTAIDLDPKDVGCYSQLGDVYSKMGSYEQAIAQYKKALEMEPDVAEPHYGLALCYNKLDLTDEEILEYRNVLAVKPDMLAAQVNLGNAYFRQGKYNLAIAQYKRALRIKPDEALTYYNLGAAYSMSKNYEQAVAAYLKAVNINSESGDTHYGLAVGYYHLEKYDLALNHLKRARELGVEVTEDQVNAVTSKLRLPQSQDTPWRKQP
jgi:tetratricopeptide (TPR) repeat protein